MTVFAVRNLSLFCPVQIFEENHRSFHSLICLLTVLCDNSAYRSVVVTDACPRKFLIAIIGTPGL